MIELKKIYEDLKNPLKEEMITVYHGTSAMYTLNIYLYGLKPKPGNQFVYVTTDIKRAEKYAKAWTAAILTTYKEDKEFREKFKDGSFNKHDPQDGMILKIRIKKSLLETDPYNPEGEPDQYRVRNKISMSKIKDWKYIKFDYAYWIGVARATDN